MIVFRIEGEPRPQGNHRTSRKGHTYETTKGHAVWRRTIAATTLVARSNYKGPLTFPLTGPVVVDVTFFLPRPKRPTHDWPTVDLDKLQRALGDGLVDGGMLADDGVIVEWKARKCYVSRGEAPAAFVGVGRLYR